MIFPSLWEGLPGAVVEARLSGLPVVASDLPGIREIARHLGGIDLLSPNADAHLWVDTAFLRLNTHHRICPDLEGSPFSIHACASAFQRIWLGKES
jgi:glycosyltransferase involved in cell wall biosynthesis